MSVKWTTEQRNVIESRNESLLVSAAAGSGKTAVLVARILSRIMDPGDPIDVDRLLVVTYTNAAAAGMRERITEAIHDALQKDPENMHLQRQSALIHNAQITTVHSFCLQLIRNHFHTIDLDPDFRVADPGELHLVKEEVFAAVLEECFQNADPAFLTFVENYSSGKNEIAIRDMVFSLFDQARSNPWPEEWLLKSSECYAVTDESTLFQKEWYQGLMSDLCLHAAENAKEMEGILSMALDPDGPASYESALRDDLAFYRSLASEKSYKVWSDLLSEHKFPTAKADRKFQGSTEKKELVKKRRDRLKAQTRKWQSTYFSMPLSEQIDAIHDTQQMYRVLCDLVFRFSDAFAAQKKKQRIVDFSDIEHFALQILLDPDTHKPTEIAREYQNRLKEVMIDEYQDSNHVQEALLSAVSGEDRGIHNRFMVGDIKQSIYRFRLARPELFLEKFDAYAKGQDGQKRIDLHLNFRSRSEILDFSNLIFSKIMQPDIGNVTYDDSAALRHGRDDTADPGGNYAPEILMIDDNDSADAQTKKEAALIASRINHMIQDAEIPGMDYGDIVILMRAPSGAADVYQEVFHDAGIPLVLETKTGYFSAREVQQVLSLLQAIDNPRQDIPLASAMKSPFGHFSSEELAQIRIAFPDMPFYEAVYQCAAGTDTSDTLQIKTRQFLSMLSAFRGQMRDMPIYRLLEEIYQTTGFVNEICALPAGKQRKANLDMLMEKAISFSKTSYQGLLHFNQYIKRLQRYEIDFGEAEIPDDGAQAVRLMSIHKSKGLEFPVVFVAGCGKQLNERDLSNTLVIHPDFGCALRQIDRTRRMKRDTLLRLALSSDLKKANLGEEMRVLYVAMTRAEKKLILTGSVKKDASDAFFQNSANEAPGFSERFRAKCYMDWILMALSVNEHSLISFLTDDDLAAMEIAHKKAVRLDQNSLYRNAYQADQKLVDEILTAFSWQYPYPETQGRQQKVSVSEIKHRAYEENRKNMDQDAQSSMFSEEILHPYIPKFMQEEVRPDGARYGTAIHFFLQNLDFSKMPRDVNERNLFVHHELLRMQNESDFDPETLKMLSEKKLCRFVTSHLADRMRTAAGNNVLFLEQPFVMSIEPDDMLTQGIIDVFWVEEDGIVLLDYKTDRVDRPEDLIKRYEIQIRLYEEALNRRFPESKVKECWIYSFGLNEAILV